MSRYVERAENLARFVDVTFNLMLDLPMGSREQWQPLVSTTGDQAWFTSITERPRATMWSGS